MLLSGDQELSTEVFDTIRESAPFPIAAAQNVPIPRCVHSPQENGGGSIADSEYRYDGGRVAPRRRSASQKLRNSTQVSMKIKPGPELYSGLAIYE